MLIQVCTDIRIFIFVLAIVYIAFGEAFLRISDSMDESNQYIANYPMAFIFSYLVSIGAGFTDYTGSTIQLVT